MEINRAMLDVCMPSRFGGIKAYVRTYVRTDRQICALYIRLADSAGVARSPPPIRIVRIKTIGSSGFTYCALV